MSILTVQQITNEALKVLSKELAMAYKPKYVKKPSYGKYKIYKIVGNTTTTVAKGLSKEAADGMLKLLKEDDDE